MKVSASYSALSEIVCGGGRGQGAGVEGNALLQSGRDGFGAPPVSLLPVGGVRLQFAFISIFLQLKTSPMEYLTSLNTQHELKSINPKTQHTIFKI